MSHAIGKVHVEQNRARMASCTGGGRRLCVCAPCSRESADFRFKHVCQKSGTPDSGEISATWPDEGGGVTVQKNIYMKVVILFVYGDVNPQICKTINGCLLPNVTGLYKTFS